jgi:tetratricopeptide (TPR) repeat protein
MLLGRLREARPQLERAVRLSPSAADAMAWLSWLERELGRFDVALDWARRAVRLDPSSSEAAHNVGATYRELGDHAEAERWFARALELQPGNPWAHTYLHYMDLERGRTEPARQRAEALLAASGGSAAILFLAGDAELWAGEWEAAERHYRALYAAAPDARLAGTWWSARLGLATALTGRGNTVEAAPLLARALEQSHARLARGEEFPPIHFEIAAIHALRGETSLALDWIERTYHAGWRHPELPHYPHIASLREEPRFRAVVSRIQQDGAAMRNGARD